MSTNTRTIARLFSNKKIAVLGAGIEGRAAAGFLRSLSVASVCVLDRNLDRSKELKADAAFHELSMFSGPAYLEHLEDAEIIIRSPGVSYLLPELQEARRRGALVTSLTKLFFQACPTTIIGITGSNGKTTTTNLTAHLLSALPHRVWRGGNDSEPLINHVDEISRDDTVVLELSSFQLQDLETSAHIAVITNITPNHLDQHQSFEEYIESKRMILAHQKKTDVALINTADPVTTSLQTNGIRFLVNTKEKDQCAYLEGTAAIIVWNGTRQEVSLKAIHFITAPENLLSAIVIAIMQGVAVHDIETRLGTFSLPAQRMEVVRTIDGVQYINDSACTTPESAVFALTSLRPHRVVVIAGGKDKGMSFASLGTLIATQQVHPILIGEAAPLISAAIAAENPEYPVDHAETLAEAVRKASGEAHSGDIILFSPACASFDMFKNSKERGKIFNEIVAGL